MPWPQVTPAPNHLPNVNPSQSRTSSDRVGARAFTLALKHSHKHHDPQDTMRGGWGSTHANVKQTTIETRWDAQRGPTRNPSPTHREGGHQAHQAKHTGKVTCEAHTEQFRRSCVASYWVQNRTPFSILERCFLRGARVAVEGASTLAWGLGWPTAVSLEPPESWPCRGV